MSGTRDSHSKRVRAAFSRQARTFEDPQLNQAFTSGLDELVAAAALKSDQLCLDVAAGTGHVARAMAPHVRAVVALDAVPEMLAEGARQTSDAGLRNIVFQRGEALALPYLDCAFDVVVTRLSLHHLTDPAVAVAEMVRVCRVGGRIVIADLVCDPGSPSPDELERLRDPSHLRVLTVQEIASALSDAGAQVHDESVERRERALEPWLEQAGSPRSAADEIRARIASELGGGTPTGLEPAVREGATRFVQLWATVVARRMDKDMPNRASEPAELASGKEPL